MLVRDGQLVVVSLNCFAQQPQFTQLRCMKRFENGGSILTLSYRIDRNPLNLPKLRLFFGGQRNRNRGNTQLGVGWEVLHDDGTSSFAGRLPGRTQRLCCLMSRISEQRNVRYGSSRYSNTRTGPPR